MNWKERTVYRILLLIAKALAEGDLKAEVSNLANHINTYRENPAL